ncbi:MAG TPA: response regulator [Chthoniobacterales bacterium]|nr:response regulator [Chthoniobacterales bacterium]
MRVLIADDEKGVGVSLSALVERCGHEVIQVVGSGFDAIQAYARLRPDVVLMDFFMPRLNGGTAARMILAQDPAAKIILISGAVTLEKMEEAGAVAVLPKPVELDKLYGALYDAAPRRGERG